VQVTANARGWVPALLYNAHLGSAVGLWPRAGGANAPDPARDFFAAAAPALFAPAAPVAALLAALRAALPPRALGGGPRRLVGLHVRVGREGEAAAELPHPDFLGSYARCAFAARRAWPVAAGGGGGGGGGGQGAHDDAHRGDDGDGWVAPARADAARRARRGGARGGLTPRAARAGRRGWSPRTQTPRAGRCCVGSRRRKAV